MGTDRKKNICNSVTDKELLFQYERNSYKNKSSDEIKEELGD